MKREFQSLSALTFFGLTSSNTSIYRKNLFVQIHNIVFHGKGGYDWNTVYNMPIWLRNFTFKEIDDYYKKESEALNKAKQGKDQQTIIDPSGKITPPQFQKKTSYK